MNDNPDHVRPIREAIEEDNAERLGTWEPLADLSRFPGYWQDHSAMTPIAYAIFCRSENAFRYLLTVVNLDATMIIRGEEYDLLSWTHRLTQRRNGQEYIPYMNMLRDAGVRDDDPNINYSTELFESILSELDEIFAEKFEYRNDDEVLQQCNTRLQNIVFRLREALKVELPDAIRRQNLLGKAILKLMEHGTDFNVDLFDLSRLFYDETTERIYERLQNDRNERNFILASSQHHNQQSPLAELSRETLRTIAQLTLAENLRGLRLGECCVCFETLDLHTVCPNIGENLHQMCGICRVNMNAGNQFTCPMCRTRMHGT